MTDRKPSDHTVLWLSLLAPWLVLQACGTSSHAGTDSSTHFLRICESSEDCGELECLCGTCTEVCDTDSACAELDSSASCGVAGASCGDSAPSCTVECQADADCPGGLGARCEQGHCVREAIDTTSEAVAGAGSSPRVSRGDGPAQTSSQGTGTPMTLAGGPSCADCTCYRFDNHGEMSLPDESPHAVAEGESAVSFYYEAPWDEAAVLVDWRTLPDQSEILAGWRLASTEVPRGDGYWEAWPGHRLGEGAQLLAVWAPGAQMPTLPAGTGMVLPPPGSTLALDWQFLNATGASVADRSAVELCVRPASGVEAGKLASLAILGTENFNGPLGAPQGMSEYTGFCRPPAEPSSDPIHIFALQPDMHRYGQEMNMVLTSGDTVETVFSEPFDVASQPIHVANPEIVVQPGDSLSTRCTLLIEDAFPVPFGTTSDSVNCYQYAYAYPAHALTNGALSLMGYTNTCF